jgi:hypothetical protein
MIHQFPKTTHLISRHHHYDVFRILRFIVHLLFMVNIHIMYYPNNNFNVHYPSVVLNNYIIISMKISITNIISTLPNIPYIISYYPL